MASDLHIRDARGETQIVRRRLIISLTVVVVLVFGLAARLYYLQVMQSEHYATLSQNNRVDLVPLPPVRGLIQDRNGVVLAENFPVYNLEIVPDQVRDMDHLLHRVRQLVDLSERDIERFQRTLKRRPWFERQTLKTGLTYDEAARFSVNQYRFRGIELRSRLQRYYPDAGLTGHVVGYVGRISEEDLKSIDSAAYKGTDHIGKLGIEAFYERRLLGDVGFEQVETNAHGRIVRSLDRFVPTSGDNVHLTIDSRLQRVATDALGRFRGSVVALDPKNGEILAMVSTPTYDPNPFVNGIDTRSYQALRTSEDRPLLNRALHGRYAPGSTIKGFLALAGLDQGIDPMHRISCPGYFSLPNSRHRYRDWRKEGHGAVDLENAIAQSCDVYFYRLARNLGIEVVHNYLTQFGFGQVTGIDLPGEPEGLVPTPAWKRRARKEPWYPGETVITGIGQGYLLVTPLQLAVATAGLANRGRFVAPRLLKGYEPPAGGEFEPAEAIAERRVNLADPSYYDRVVEAMRSVVHGPRGTARAIGSTSAYEIAGKTGTAQVIGIAQGEEYDEESIEERFRDHSLFIAFAPVDDPRIALAVVVENGGGGSRTAAPIARRVLDYYLVERLRRASIEVAPRAVQRG